MHDTREPRIISFLRAGNGEMTRAAFLNNHSMFWTTVVWMKQMAHRDFECLLENYSSTANLYWGFKEPHYAWLLPVMDEAFYNLTKYLIVARDPRDICSNSLQDQFEKYGQYMGQPDCYKWWSGYWSHLLDAYEHDARFAVVRIEDLVVPDPRLSLKAVETLNCVITHIGMQVKTPELVSALRLLQGSEEMSSISVLHSTPASEAALRRYPPEVRMENIMKEVQVLHEHKGAYMGHHNNQTKDDRFQLARLLAVRTDEPVIHATMKRLGYDVEDFKLNTPTSPAVLCHR